MLVRQGDRSILEARAKADPAENVLTEDFYTQLPQIRLTADPTSRQRTPAMPTEVTLDDTDVARLVECAIRHPNPNMRYAAMAAIWNHADSFQQIFRFGLDAPDGFPEIRKIVAEELERRPAAPGTRGADPLLPRVPLSAHLRDRERR
jgi:hypothetical protein